MRENIGKGRVASPKAGCGGGCDRNSLKAGHLPAYRRARPAKLQDGSRRGALPELAFCVNAAS
jgi:hypothetical protein